MMTVVALTLGCIFRLGIRYRIMSFGYQFSAVGVLE